jgi:hypothetical protein
MRTFRDLLGTAMVAIAFVAIFEGGLRLAGVRYEYSFYESDPVLYTTYRPNAEGWEVKESENFVRMNSHGMRDRERSVAAAPGTVRVALLGDSVVAATQVPFEDTMGQVLERRLTSAFGRSGRGFEVLNFAQGGNTLAQQHLMLRERVWAFRPQIVVVFVSPISVPTASRKLDRVAAPKPFYVMRAGQLIPDPRNSPPAASAPEARRWNGILKNAMNRYRLLLVLRQATDHGLEKLEALGAVTRSASAAEPDRDTFPMDIWFRPPARAEVHEAWRVVEGLLRLIAEDTRRHGAELWMASVGPAPQENPDARGRTAFLEENGYSGVNYSEDRFERFAKGERIPYVRISPRMLAHAERHGVSVRGFFNTTPNSGHWNVEGNSAAAGIVGDELLARSDVLRVLREAGSRQER